MEKGLVMYYNYQQYLAYVEASNAVKHFNDTRPKTNPAIAVTDTAGNQHFFNSLADLDNTAINPDCIIRVAPSLDPVINFPNFYELIKEDVSIESYKSRLKEILLVNSTRPIILTPTELHYLQTGIWDEQLTN